MVVIHNLLRKTWGEMPALVDGVAVGDVARAGIVGKHLDDLAAALHNHHHGEDLLLWDELSARAPSCALHVEQMKADHAAMSADLDRLTRATPEWRAAASAESKATITGILQEILAGLGKHLPSEEQQILPVASTSFSQAEWDRLGEHARAEIPRDQMFIQLGYILDSLPEDERDRWSKEFLPVPARIAWGLVGKRQFEKHRAELLGTA